MWEENILFMSVMNVFDVREESNTYLWQTFWQTVVYASLMTKHMKEGREFFCISKMAATTSMYVLK